MRVLLTGASGFIGRTVARMGSGEHDFVLLDSAAQVETAGGIRGNILDRDTLLRAAEGCDAIIHTAALHAHFAESATSQEYLQTNVIGTQNVFDAAIANGVRRVILSSSLTVNIGINGAAAGPVVINEQSEPKPDHMYPASKLLAEQLGHYYARTHNLEVVQFRYGYVRDNDVTTYGLGLLSRSVAVEDVARANLLALTQPGLKDHLLLVAAKTPFTAEDLAWADRDPWSMVERYWPGSRKVLQRSGRQVLARHLYPIFQINRAREVLGWEPHTTFETFLGKLGWHPNASAALRRSTAVSGAASH